MSATVHEFTPARGFKKATTAEVKRALVKHFNHKFSVKKGRGTASHWMDVSWTDGPPEPVVRSFLGVFNDTSRDDLMTDLWCGSQYTSNHRDISNDALMFMAALVAKKFGLPKPRFKVKLNWYKTGYYLDYANDPVVNDWNHERFSTLVHRATWNFDFNKGMEVEG